MTRPAPEGATHREFLRTQFGHLTAAEIRVRIENNDGIDVKHARQWLDFLAEEQRDEEVKRARDALHAAHRAAVAAEGSARYAMWAAIIALMQTFK